MTDIGLFLNLTEPWLAGLVQAARKLATFPCRRRQIESRGVSVSSLLSTGCNIDLGHSTARPPSLPVGRGHVCVTAAATLFSNEAIQILLTWNLTRPNVYRCDRVSFPILYNIIHMSNKRVVLKRRVYFKKFIAS